MPDDHLEFDWRHIPASGRAELDTWRRDGALILEMLRHGIDHGALVVGDVPPPSTADARTAWQRGAPVFRPDAVTAACATFANATDQTLAMFERLRDGARFLDEVEQRLWDSSTFRYQGSTVDHLDSREIEKLFVEIPTGTPGSYLARNLSARLSWASTDESDASLAIRCSWGHAATRDWLSPDPRAVWSDRFAAELFPECAVVTEDAALGAELLELVGEPYRLSERTVHCDTPGGGETFQHAAEPGQLGVVLAQLRGVAIWLALPRSELEAGLRRHRPDLQSDALDAEPPAAIRELLDESPTFTAELAAAGHLFAVGPGDVLLLPSHGPAVCAWHSGFGTGDEPSLGHRYAIFAALAEPPTGSPPSA